MNWSWVGGRITGSPARTFSQRQEANPAARAAAKRFHRPGATDGSKKAMKHEPGRAARDPPSFDIERYRAGTVPRRAATHDAAAGPPRPMRSVASLASAR